MKTLEDLITRVLSEEAQDAPDTDAFVARMLGPGATPVRRERPAWLVPVGIAAATALILAFTMTSTLWQRRTEDSPPDVSRPPTVTDAAHAGRIHGWIALRSGSVHIEMNAIPHAAAWWRDWNVGCPDSALAVVEIGDVACTGTPQGPPRYEVLVGQGTGLTMRTTPRLTLTGTLQVARIDSRRDHRRCGGPCNPQAGGQPSQVRRTTATVRYDCPGACGSPTQRVVTVIGFPREHAHVTVLSPPGESITWLTDFIYVDAPR
jgi:hypothetical protein